MNENELFYLLTMGMGLFCLLYVIFTQSRRIKNLQELAHSLSRDYVILARSKEGDFPTARLMASVAKQSAGATILTDPKEETKANKFTIEQAG